MIKNLIDKKNDNGFIIDMNIIENIFTNIENESLFFGNVLLSQKDDNKKKISELENVKLYMEIRKDQNPINPAPWLGK